MAMNKYIVYVSYKGVEVIEVETDFEDFYDITKLAVDKGEYDE